MSHVTCVIRDQSSLMSSIAVDTQNLCTYGTRNGVVGRSARHRRHTGAKRVRSRGSRPTHRRDRESRPSTSAARTHTSRAPPFPSEHLCTGRLARAGSSHRWGGATTTRTEDGAIHAAHTRCDHHPQPSHPARQPRDRPDAADHRPERPLPPTSPPTT